MTLPKELKEAISKLTSKDKDKLIFRLLKKDLVLANQLLFELVSDENVEEKRAQVKKNSYRTILNTPLFDTILRAGFTWMFAI